MTKYWIRIALGMLLIFGVGMAVVTAGRRGAATVHAIANSSDPIEIPVPFMPLRLNGEKIGGVERVRVLRDLPKHVTGVEVSVSVPDTANVARLGRCLLTLNDEHRFNNNSTLICSSSADTAGRALTAFATVIVEGSGQRFPLLLTQAAAADFAQVGGGSPATARVDRATRRAERAKRVADSLQALADKLRDSVAAAPKP